MIPIAKRAVVLAMIVALANTAWAQPSPSEMKLGEEIQLFNGKNLEGWGFFLVDPNVKMEDVWCVKDGILVGKGEPLGYLASEKTFKDFKLVVEWRWAPGKEPGNSGVLMRITGEPKFPPKCVEAQLKHGDAGDVWAFDGFQLKGDADRYQEVDHEKLGHMIGVRRIAGSEKPPGEWNQCSITLDGGRLTVEINGQVVNYAADCSDIEGKIGLQSEGGEVQFRTVKLMPIVK